MPYHMKFNCAITKDDFLEHQLFSASINETIKKKRRGS